MSDVVNMTKGEAVNLTKAVPQLQHVRVGAGWDVAEGGPSLDADLACFLLDASGNVRGADDFIFYNHLRNNNGSVVHQGDNLTGEGEGDDEVILINLEGLDPGVMQIDFVLDIYQAASKGQSLADLTNAFIRIINDTDEAEISRFEITDGLMGDAMVFGSLIRGTDGWEFRAKGDTRTAELTTIATEYGLNASAEPRAA